MRLLLLPLILLLALAGPARAEEPIAPAIWQAEQSALCAAGLKEAEQKWNIPHGLLATMAKVESGRPLPGAGLQPWPWTIDADGQGYFFQSKAAAVAWAEQAKERGVRLMDVGCMQVNLQYHPNAFASLDQAFDPVANADYAARFLRRLKEGNAGRQLVHRGRLLPLADADPRRRLSPGRGRRRRRAHAVLRRHGAALHALAPPRGGAAQLRRRPCHRDQHQPPTVPAPPQDDGLRDRRRPRQLSERCAAWLHARPAMMAGLGVGEEGQGLCPSSGSAARSPLGPGGPRPPFALRGAAQRERGFGASRPRWGSRGQSPLAFLPPSPSRP